MLSIKEWLQKFVNGGTLLIAAGGVFWTFGGPLAEDLIKKTVDANVAAKIKELETSVAEIKSAQSAANISQAVTASKLTTLEAGQAEQRSDIKDILKGLRNNGLVQPAH